MKVIIQLHTGTVQIAHGLSDSKAKRRSVLLHMSMLNAASVQTVG